MREVSTLLPSPKEYLDEFERSRKKRGRLRLAREVQEEPILLLLGHYQENQAFVGDLMALGSRYARLLKALAHGATARMCGAHRFDEPDEAWKALHHLMDSSFVQTAKGWRKHRTKFTYLRRYCDELFDLGHDWGFRGRWTDKWLHAALLERLVLESFGHRREAPKLTGLVRGYPFMSADVETIRIEEPVDDTDTWESVRARILKYARTEWDWIQFGREGRDWTRRDSRPELARHVRWLYLRICPKRRGGRVRSWHEIAKDDQFAVTTVTSTVKSLASEMGIWLPNVPRGRPAVFQE